MDKAGKRKRDVIKKVRVPARRAPALARAPAHPRSRARRR
jgi:hypothetical protein